MKFFLLIIPVILVSCSTKKQLRQTEQDSSSFRAEQSIQADSSYIRLKSGSLLLSREQTYELTRIIPRGTFSYSTDSGFRGEAGEIRVVRHTGKKLLQSDSSRIDAGTVSQAGQTRIQGSDVRSNQLDERKSSEGFSVKPWMWGIVLLVVVAGVVKFKA